MTNEKLEMTVGAIVVLLAVLGFGYISGQSPEYEAEQNGYEIHARFNRTDGLKEGDEVRLAGMPVGIVDAQKLNGDYGVDVTLHINNSFRLPDDSSASIQTSGIFGRKFIELEPGGSEDIIEPGGEIGYTQDSMVVEELLNKIIAMAKAKRAENNDGEVEKSSNE